MSILTPITRLVLLAAAGGIAYVGVTAAMPDKVPEIIEPGFVNIAHVEFYDKKNADGNFELYLLYDNGTEQMSLPVMNAVNGPSIGSSDYQWSNIDGDTKTRYVSEGWENLGSELKSELVVKTWNELLVESRVGILRRELADMLEMYGGK